MTRLLPLLLLLLAIANSAHAQIVDSLVHYCPPARLSLLSAGDTVVVRPETYRIAVGQIVYLRAIQCGVGKARDVSRLRGVRWTSSDTTVATVARTTGRVRVRRPGRVTISATYPSRPDGEL